MKTMAWAGAGLLFLTLACGGGGQPSAGSGSTGSGGDAGTAAPPVTTPPAPDGGTTVTPPATDGGTTVTPPATDGGTTVTPPATDGGTIVAPPPASTYTLFFHLVGSGEVNGSNGLLCGTDCSMTLSAGTSLDLTATPALGQFFSEWQGACSGNSTCHLTMNADQHLTAVFADDCTRLLPNPNPGPSAHAHDIDAQGIGAMCKAGISDGDGTLAFQGVDEGTDQLTDFVSNAGATLNSYAGDFRSFGGQLAGFEGQLSDFSTRTASLALWDTDGALLKSLPVSGSWVADPTGGIVVMGDQTLTAYDPQLNQRWTQQVMTPSQASGVSGTYVDRQGNSLIVFETVPGSPPYTILAMWVDHAGNAGSVFPLGSPSEQFPAEVVGTPRVGSGLFVRINGQWTGQLDSLSTGQMQPAPEFLTARPFSTVQMIRNGTGYAVTNTPSGCSIPLTVASASGEVCGSPVFQTAGPVCSSEWASVGYDGSVIVNYNPHTLNRCTWEWWPGFFQ
jgi:hypothetical protein